MTYQSIFQSCDNMTWHGIINYITTRLKNLKACVIYICRRYLWCSWCTGQWWEVERSGQYGDMLEWSAGWNLTESLSDSQSVVTSTEHHITPPHRYPPLSSPHIPHHNKSPEILKISYCNLTRILSVYLRKKFNSNDTIVEIEVETILFFSFEKQYHIVLLTAKPLTIYSQFERNFTNYLIQRKEIFLFLFVRLSKTTPLFCPSWGVKSEEDQINSQVGSKVTWKSRLFENNVSLNENSKNGKNLKIRNNIWQRK